MNKKHWRLPHYAVVYITTDTVKIIMSRRKEAIQIKERKKKSRQTLQVTVALQDPHNQLPARAGRIRISAHSRTQNGPLCVYPTTFIAGSSRQSAWQGSHFPFSLLVAQLTPLPAFVFDFASFRVAFIDRLLLAKQQISKMQTCHLVILFVLPLSILGWNQISGSELEKALGSDGPKLIACVYSTNSLLSS